MTKGFMALFLILLTGMLGVFLSLDLFLLNLEALRTKLWRR